MPEPDYKTRHEFTGSGLEPRELEALVATLPLLLEEEDSLVLCRDWGNGSL